MALPALTGTAHADAQSDEASFVSRLNQVRASRGLAPLAVDARLTEVARAWSANMAGSNRLYHNPNLAAQAPGDWQKLGENVGYGGEVGSVHDAFVASPDHFRNMVDPAFNAVGLGVVWSGNRLWVTQVFMKGPVVLLQSAGAADGTAWYRIARASGDVHTFGAAGPFAKAPTSAPVTAIASTTSGDGYWQAASNGAVFSAGDAKYFGGMPAGSLASPVVGMAATKTNGGYWLLGRDGGVFSFGDAKFHGSTGGMRLNQPVVGMTASPTGGGYWFVASDGGIFSFGDAKFFGSTGAIRLNQPIVGMAATKSGNGYWLVASDGGIFAFGDAKFHGSTGAIRLNQPIVGMAPTPSGNGYWLVAADGGVFAFGDAGFLGSAAGAGLGPVVGMVAGA
ncbi:MAG TPA: CAP domain-containing protein [Acidimicrobiales bacterium]|nr:CAP domain-containing protein [Acidimicrobiales bacterium]